jgi:type VI secretion system protein ImpE
MSAEEHLRNGNLQGALEDLKVRIRKEPEKSRYRIFYFQLLAVLGRWQAALNQLNVLGKLDQATYPMVQTYKAAILCEMIRAEIFTGRKTPLIFGEPLPWMAWLVESLRLTADSQYAQAVELRAQAFDLAEASSGTLDDEPFEWIADADSRLGPVLEVILNGKYYWVPFQQIRSLNISPPEDLRDLVWLPAQFVWVNGSEAVGLIPIRYPATELADDSTLQLARTTKWREVSEGVYFGLGQRMLATSRDDYSLLEVKCIEME